MKNSKLLRVFLALSPEEIRRLDKFVRSPLHNRHKDVIRLFQYLRKHSGAGLVDLDKKHLFDYLFPGEAFQMQKVHYVTSYLLRVIEDFLAWQEWDKDLTARNIYLLRAYEKHQLDRAFLQGLDRAFKQQSSQDLRNAHYHQQYYQLQYEKYKQTLTEGRMKQFNLQELVHSQDIAFISEKLKNACILLSHQTVVNQQYDTGLLHAVLDYLEQYPNWLTIPAIAVHYHAYRALMDMENDQHFVEFKNLLLLHANRFNMAELRDNFVMAINYCIRKANLGHAPYLKELFELYKSGLAIDVFLKNGILSRWTYNNIIIAGLNLQAYDWVHDFIYQYKERLAEKHQAGNFNFNLARYHFEKREYNAAMSLLLQREYDDLLHNLAAKTMLAKIYFRLEEEEALDHLLNSFRTYIYRKKVLGYHKENYLNIINYIRKLSALMPGDKQQSQKLRSEVMATSILTEKNWLLEQIEAITPN
ncbi:MAG: hypothetical protein AAFP19_13295 [Bacteroidota bacterium]